MIYIDADANNATWRHVAEAGGYTHYQGQANNGDVVIRFGANHGRYQNRYPAGVRVLNPRLTLSKMGQYNALRRNNVPTPTIFGTRTEWEAARRPQLIRKPDIGQMGVGVQLVDGWPRQNGGALLQQYVNKDREFRAMMVGGLLAFFMEKHPPANGDVRWNEHQGSQWTRVPDDRTLRNRVKQLGEAALAALEYDFGAIDIIMQGDMLYVLEVNSRPEFGEVNARRFANAVTQYVEEGGPQPRGTRRRNQEAAPRQRPADEQPRQRNERARGQEVRGRDAAQGVERAQQRRFCHQCGFRVEENHRFCEGCGRDL